MALFGMSNTGSYSLPHTGIIQLLESSCMCYIHISYSFTFNVISNINIIESLLVWHLNIKKYLEFHFCVRSICIFSFKKMVNRRSG